MALQKEVAQAAQKVLPWIQPETIEIAGFGLEDDVHLLALMNIFNEAGFCGKILVSLPGWTCPMHHHLGKEHKKDEGFLVLSGTLQVTTPTQNYAVQAGQTLFLQAGTRHALSSASSEGVVYIEFSDRDTRTDIFDDVRVRRDPEIEEDVPGYVAPRGGFKIWGEEGPRLNPGATI
jgi:mannose-6-phosphate isomerase-like protein (cupin superfamily)